MTRPRRSLFLKYFLNLFAAVIVPLTAGGASEAWFGYRDQRERLNDLLTAESQLAAHQIQNFIDGIAAELGFAVQLAWPDSTDGQHRFDALRVLRQVPAITSITLADGDGRERVYVSRTGLDRMAALVDLSRSDAFLGARTGGVWYGPVTFERESEPYMTISVAGNRSVTGVAIARTNLKLIWDVVSAIKVGETGHAFVLDRQGRLIAHPDLSLVLRGDANGETYAALRQQALAAGGAPFTATDNVGRRVVAATAPIRGAGWSVVVEQPEDEAFAPIRQALWRVGALIVAGVVLALGLAYGLARRMTKPIRELEIGAEHIGEGQFDYRLQLATGDELEGLANRFNAMAGELAISKEKTERINRLKRFLAPQVAELVESAGGDSLLLGQRRDVAVIFVDLRNFTAFSAHTEPETVMAVLEAYYVALGAVITRHGVTLTNLAGDGAMVLVGAPVRVARPATEAVRVATEMQAEVQVLIAQWRQHGHEIGFGIGIAMGSAIVGRIGYEGRLDYTAIGNVVNLASRLCAVAADGQILVDNAVAQAVGAGVTLEPMASPPLKGYDSDVVVFAVAANAILSASQQS